MNFKPAEKMKNFEAGIFQILDKKKKELEKARKKECTLKEKNENCFDRNENVSIKLTVSTFLAIVLFKTD